MSLSWCSTSCWVRHTHLQSLTATADNESARRLRHAQHLGDDRRRCSFLAHQIGGPLHGCRARSADLTHLGAGVARPKANLAAGLVGNGAHIGAGTALDQRNQMIGNNAFDVAALGFRSAGAAAAAAAARLGEVPRQASHTGAGYAAAAVDGRNGGGGSGVAFIGGVFRLEPDVKQSGAGTTQRQADNQWNDIRFVGHGVCVCVEFVRGWVEEAPRSLFKPMGCTTRSRPANINDIL